LSSSASEIVSTGAGPSAEQMTAGIESEGSTGAAERLASGSSDRSKASADLRKIATAGVTSLSISVVRGWKP
jgi:hypothetical protein